MMAAAHVFDWFKDSAGYDLQRLPPGERRRKEQARSLQGEQAGGPTSTSQVLELLAGDLRGDIIRHGGALTPTTIKIDGLHKQFARVETMADALRFVQQYGFLRFSGAKSEGVEEILRAADRLREAVRMQKNAQNFYGLPHDDPALLSSRQKIAESWRKNVQASTRVALSVGANGISLTMAPINLLGAIWCDFANDLLGGVTTRACENCGKIFEIGQGAARADKRTCSERCQRAVSRRKQKESQQ